jgi:peptidoglycan/LPS O-acetylase OafA/YrhL
LSLSSFVLCAGLLLAFWGFAWIAVRRSAGAANDAAASGSVMGGEKLAAIDGLRGVLALSVFVHHASCARNFFLNGRWEPMDAVFNQMGTYAVTLFFFITGFLFWTKLQRDPRPGLARHLRSRLLRVGPAYWASVAVIVLLVAAVSRGRLQESPVALAKHIGSWVLFTLPGSVNINDVRDTWKFNAGVAWTLRLEWVFYLLIPFCGWFAGRAWRVILFLAALAALHWLAMRAVSVDAIPWVLRDLALQSALYLLLFFSGGIVAAAARPWLKERLTALDFRRPAFSAAGLAAVAATILFVEQPYGSPRETLALFLPFLLVALGNDWGGFLASRPALFLGKISYSVYLLHGIVLYLACRGLDKIFPVAEIPAAAYWVFVAALGGVVIAVAALWHRWFEAPFMRPGASARPAEVRASSR